MARHLPADSRAALRAAKIDLASTPLPLAVDMLDRQIAAATTQLLQLTEMPPQSLIQVGNSFLPAEYLAGYHVKAAAVPTTKGSVAPVGVGDLLVVKQNLKRYEAREISHIENILKGEFKNREHRRSRTTEETLTIEKETKKEEERDQQSTERFELKTEANNIIKEDSSLKIGLAVSGSYGPMVEFKATTDFGLNKSKEESTKVATSYSKDVTNRAASKTLERTSEERILKTIEVFEEKNAHGFDNKAGAEHVIGQYQWVDKIYEAQVFNYGKRMLFDLMVPEPAAFLLYALGSRPPVGADLVKPSPFTLKPTDLTEANYAYYVAKYGATGVEAPPKPYITVSKTFDGADDRTDRGEMTKVADVPIPTGYFADAAGVTVYLTYWDGSAARLAVTVGRRSHIFKPSAMGLANTALDGEVDSIPAAVLTFRVAVFTATFDVTCRRTPRALDDWKLKTHAAIPPRTKNNCAIMRKGWPACNYRPRPNFRAATR